MNQRTIWGSQRGKWITLAALVAILVALLAVGMVRAQDAAMMSERDYAENGTDPVVTLTAADPEMRMVYWSLLPAATDVNDISGVDIGDDVDASHFMITPSADGASASLSFKFPPDYEMPRGGMMTETNNNTYKVVVVAADDAPGAVVAEDLNETYHKLTVMVTDEDEDGSISLSTLQPQVDVVLTVTLMDDDAEAIAVDGAAAAIVAEWKWEQASAMSGPWTLISGATTASYMPAADVVGMYLRATATYDDKHGDDKTAMAVSANAVRAVPSGTNSVPTFPVGADDNDRDVDENSPPGTNVGDPLKASDSPGEILTYTLTGTNAELYSIDRATGQISVSARTMLNREDLTSPYQHTVIVTATDPYGPPDVNPVTQEVTITINDVNEAPTVSGGPTRIKHLEGSTAIDLDSENQDADVPTYAATDAESIVGGGGGGACNEDTDNTCAWSLEGPDAADFTIDDGTDGTTFGQLAFKNAPDFENPADADMDNVYMVTVKVTDNGVASKNKMSATRDVMITVTNDNEDGEVTFSSVQPKVGRPFTATLTDPDGMTTGVKWEWNRTSSDPADCINVGNLVFDMPIDEESDSYTPKEADLGECLEAKATYTDPVGPTMAMGASGNVVIANSDNVAPEFRVDGELVMQATRNIAENSVSVTGEDSGNVEAPVVAIDPNGDLLTYTLGGPDEDSFEIEASSGQITVGADTELDYESNKKTYMVTVTATDPSQAMTTIDVTIDVTDVNEAPEFTAPSEGDVEKTVKENASSLNIYTFQATDPERRKVYWSLSDAADAEDSDRGQFTINDRGALILNASPNYEDDTGLGSDKQYTVVVVASDDAPGAGVDTEDDIKDSMKTVTVIVTDIEETGTITLVPKYPHPATDVTATLTDGDGTPSTVVWEWTVAGVAVGTNSPSYLPLVGDVGKALRVKASYTEGEGKVVSASAGTVRATPPANVAPVFVNSPENNAREVAENARNTRLGKAIRATDANSDALTYTVDEANFSISPSGQLSTAAMLDFEDDGTVNPVLVTITATDPWGLAGTIEVMVTVEDVNEAPMINMGPTRRDHAENTAIDIEIPIGNYVATDVDATDVDALTWSLEGEDASMFKIAEVGGMLTFKESPNYEMPADRNKDNVYKVTVVVSDGGAPKLMDKRQVEISVTDVEEEGIVTLSAVQPKIGIDLMASLTDPDNVTSTDTDGRIETGVTWQWWRTASNDEGTAPLFLNVDAQVNETDWEKIADAKSDTYKPVSGDENRSDETRWLNAMATYTDRRGSVKLANMSSANAVIANSDNVAPEFREDGDEPVMQATRDIAENSVSDTAVGKPVMATDPNSDDLLTYTLSGSDAALFSITHDTDADAEAEGGRGGQVKLKTGTKLDYEARTTYMVTVTAADPDGEMASVDVTIKVTDENEAPMISTGPSIVGPAMSYYAENDMVAVASYEGAALNSPSWSLSGDDAGDFSISSDGMLTFNNTPDYEMPEDAGGNNVYDVTVKATDGTNPVMKNVKVMVTNVEELGTLSGDSSPSYEEGGEGAVGTYTASGGSMSDVANWSLMGDDMGDLSISTGGVLTFDATPNYEMPMDKDMDNTYMVTVMAEAGGEMDTQDVMVRVTDVDEMGLTVTGRSSVDYLENRTDSVATYTATDPESATITWSLDGDDAGDFVISTGGVLTFRSSPDYEAAADDDTDNAYEVTVVASAGTNEGRLDVTVTVTDVEETQLGFDPLAEYDADNSGSLEKDEVIQAINDYLFGEGADAISKDDVIEIINLYLFG